MALDKYQQVCYIAMGAPRAGEAMVLEPYQQNLPNLPKGTVEKCNRYNNAPGTLMTKPPDGLLPNFYWLADLSAKPDPYDVQNIETSGAARIARQVALAHSQRCWIGGGDTWFSLDHPTGQGDILEYWR